MCALTQGLSSWSLRGGGPVPLGRGGRGAGSALPGDQSDDDVGYRRGAPRARVANSGQNANSAEMERHGVGLDVAFAPLSQSSAAASSSETAAVQPRTPDASPRTRPGTVATLSYDSSPNTEVSQLKAESFARQFFSGNYFSDGYKWLSITFCKE